MKAKIKWKVADAPTGPYRSFIRRGWPSADYSDGTPCAWISCEDDYVPSLVRQGKHAELSLYIADHSVKPWQKKRAKQRFATLDEAKTGLLKILEANPHLMPIPPVTDNAVLDGGNNNDATH